MQQRGPWRIKRTTAKYKNPWIEVYEHQVIRPDGKAGIYGTIKATSGSLILPIDDENNVYLVQDYRFALGHESIELPGGAIEKAEESLSAARRELKEELGIIARQWIPLGKFDQFTSSIESISYLFIAKNLTFSTAEMDGTEQIKMIKVPFIEAVKMVMDGRISHGASCLLILKAKQYFNNKFHHEIK